MITVIKRCPSCPVIQAHTDDILTALAEDFDIEAELQDGANGEFTVLVDDVPLLQRDIDTLPSTEEVEAAVSGAATCGMQGDLEEPSLLI
ncbi:hypothetical protein [Zavarzinella formosa]|uniref:hypothetical protein n=1 Tax=Zavarzinella formosa TaxID=360055 RepID=UPI0002E2569D|nr:hypothetical protein [Zavarzinella formosa]